MKKILIVTALLLVAASPAFAVVTYSIDFTTAGLTGLPYYGDKTTASATTPLIGKTSTGVGLGILVNTAGSGYAVITQHKNGTKQFGSSFDSTAVYSNPVATDKIGVNPASPNLAVPTATTSVDFISGTWASM